MKPEEFDKLKNELEIVLKKHTKNEKYICILTTSETVKEKGKTDSKLNHTNIFNVNPNKHTFAEVTAMVMVTEQQYMMLKNSLIPKLGTPQIEKKMGQEYG